jgi:hypothetical protein
MAIARESWDADFAVRRDVEKDGSVEAHRCPLTKCAPLRQVEVENSAVALDSLNGFGNVRDECCDAVNAILGFLAYGAIHKFACERLRKRPALRRMRGLVVEHRAPFENRMLGDVIVFVPIEHSPLKEPVEDLSERIDISVDLGSICSSFTPLWRHVLPRAHRFCSLRVAAIGIFLGPIT